MHWILLIFNFIFCIYLTYSQNLIKNYSFEDIKDITTFVEGEEISKEWAGALSKNVNHWSCPTNYCPMIRHFASSAHSGNVTISLITYSRKGYRNYVEQELSSPLKAGAQYFVMFYANSLHGYLYFSNNLGVAFSENKLTTGENIDVQILEKEIIKDSWKIISGIFTAGGDEKYIYIGNFFNNKETSIKRRKIDYQYTAASYNIDDILLFEVPDNIDHLEEEQFVMEKPRMKDLFL